MKKLLLFIVCFLVSSYRFSFAELLITEVVPDEPNGRDWVEIVVIASTVNVSNYKLLSWYYSTPKEIVTLPNWVLQRGDHIVVDIDPTRTHLNTYRHPYGFYVVESSYSISQKEGIRASDGILFLRNASGTFVDFVIFTDGDFPSDMITQYNTAVSTGQWSPAGALPENCVRFRAIKGESETGKSITRKRNFNGMPLDTNTKNDWLKVVAPTPGGGYEVLSPEMKAIITVKEPNPFCPTALEPTRKIGAIAYKVEGASVQKTIRIYNIQGRYIKSLMESDAQNNEGILTWDGTDNSGKIQPPGIYIVYMEAYNTQKNSRVTAKDVIAIGLQQ